MDEKPNYYAIIPATVRYDNELRANEKLLYGEITALTQKTGECWANNKYFSELYGVKNNAIAVWIRHLKEKKYIDVSYIYKGNEIDQRIIKICDIQKNNTYSQKDRGVFTKRYEGGIQKGEDNNTSINNTSINNKEIYKERQKEMFLDFWSRYPKKEKKSKTEEWFIKHKLTDEEFKLIINSLDKFKNSSQWKNKQFIPLPITWLNQKRWEDEIEDDSFYKLINEGIIIK